MSGNLTRRQFGLAAAATAMARPAWAQETPRLKREASFFGIHLDLHPQETDKELGMDLTEEMVEDFLTRVKPDYVQYDSKGHAGWLGFASKTGQTAPGIVKDSLEIWRKVTARRGVSLYIHFSGVWDTLAVTRHPEWARVDEKGNRDKDQTSTFGPYVDELMIPELREAATRYNLDGAWIDGECWATKPDYSESAVAGFLRKSGLKEVPKKAGDEGWNDWLDYNRDQFRSYLKHYLAELKKSNPSFQIASNWMYTTYVPERPVLPVAYVSGDYLGNASISSARLEARYLTQIGKPWDLMAWGFQSAGSNTVGHVHKPAVQLAQEASVVLAQGGGFQIYYVPSRAGRLNPGHVAVAAEVAKFCRARQAASHKAEVVPEIGVLFSGHSLYKTSNKLFGGWAARVSAARGVVDALVESHLLCDVIPDWKLAEDVAKYKLLVVPDWEDIGDAAAKVITGFAARGGRTVLFGVENCERFASLLGMKVTGKTKEKTETWGAAEGELMPNLTGLWLEVQPTDGQVIEKRFKTYDELRDGTTAGMIHGTVAGIAGPVGKIFAATHQPAVRKMIARTVKRLYTPPVEIDGPPTVEVVLKRKNGKMFLHLLNSTAMQVAGDYSVSDFVPAVGPVGVKWTMAKAPRQVRLIPSGAVVTGRYEAGVWSGSVEKLEVHAALEVEM